MQINPRLSQSLDDRLPNKQPHPLLGRLYVLQHDFSLEKEKTWLKNPQVTNQILIQTITALSRFFGRRIPCQVYMLHRFLCEHCV